MQAELVDDFYLSADHEVLVGFISLVRLVMKLCLVLFAVRWLERCVRNRIGAITVALVVPDAIAALADHSAPCIHLSAHLPTQFQQLQQAHYGGS